MAKVALICGISGQDGAYLAELLIKSGYHVVGTSRDAELSSFPNLVALGLRDQVDLKSMSLTDFRSVLNILTSTRPDEIYNLAGQSSVGLSFIEPVDTMQSHILGTLNILEAVRYLGASCRIYNAGSGECFGNLDGRRAKETDPFYPRSPYAVAKAAAHWECVNYREAYDLFVCNGILFNHESPLRPSRFVTRKVTSAACQFANGRKGKLRIGNLSIRRDWGWAPEYVQAMWLMLQQDRADDYVIATGQNASLQDFVAEAFRQVNLDWADHVEVDESLFRPSEVKENCGDPTKANDRLGWRASVLMQDVVKKMISAELVNPARSE